MEDLIRKHGVWNVCDDTVICSACGYVQKGFKSNNFCPECGADMRLIEDKDTEFWNDPSQTAKSDAGKPRLTLVPRKIIFDIARVREYGNLKYKDPENWRTVAKERYRDAAYRHFMAYLDDPNGTDEESGLPHLSHLACNIAFLCEMEGE